MSTINPRADTHELRLHAVAPKPARKIKRKAVIIAATLLTLMTGIAVVTGFSPRAASTSEHQSKKGTGHPGKLVQGLPDSYAALAKRPTPVPPVKQQAEPVTKKADPSDYELLLKELALKRAKRRIEARESDLSFPKVKDPERATKQVNFRPPQPASVSVPQVGPINLSERMAGDDTSQTAKDEFLREERREGTLLMQGLQSPISAFQLNAGTVIPAMFVTGVNSDLPGQLLGQVSQNVFDTVSGQHLLVPQGTKVLGLYDSRIAYGQERVLIVWTRLQFPNGKSISLEGMPGVDMSGYAGVKDRVNHHYLRLLTGVLFGSLLSASAQVAEGRTYNVEPSYGELAMQGVARNTNDVGQQITRRNLNIQPTLEIRPGMRFNVFTTKDIVLEPYNKGDRNGTK